MPHLILDHSANLVQAEPLATLFQVLHEVLVAEAGCRREDIKSRAECRGHFRVGDGDVRNAFAHLEVGLLEGRDSATLARIGRACLEVLATHFARALQEQHCDLTVELRPMRRDSYFKLSSHPTFHA